MDSFFAWMPFLLILAAVAVIGRYQMRSYSDHVNHVQAINDQILAQNREMVSELREIKQLLRDRS